MTRAAAPAPTAITRDDQVQIYEERARDPEGWLTTSFLAIDSVVKENRALYSPVRAASQ